MTSEKGTKKEVGTRDYVIVLNQCDTEEERRRAGKIENAVRQARRSGDSVPASMQRQEENDGGASDYCPRRR